MITELEIDGFKSFGSPAKKLKLGALNFVVVTHASGKTNLLAALRFLPQAVMQNVEYAVSDLGGSIKVRKEVLHRLLRLNTAIAQQEGAGHDAHAEPPCLVQGARLHAPLQCDHVGRQEQEERAHRTRICGSEGV